MTKSETPDDPGETEDPPRRAGRTEQQRPEKQVPEFVRRLVEAGLDKLGERPDQIRQRLAELKLPKEQWLNVLAQLDDGKSGIYRVVAKEVKDFLQNTNFADDLVRALTKLSFEIRTEVRFIPNAAGVAKPKVKSRVEVKTDGDDSPAPTKDPTE